MQIDNRTRETVTDVRHVILVEVLPAWISFTFSQVLTKSAWRLSMWRKEVLQSSFESRQRLCRSLQEGTHWETEEGTQRQQGTSLQRKEGDRRL